jgi:hypothetical protein
MTGCPTITLEGEPLTDAEQRVLMIVHCLSASGMAPIFDGEDQAENLTVAKGLCARGMLVQAEEAVKSLCSDERWPPGFHFPTHKAEWIGAMLFESSGLEFQDLV